MSSGSFQGTTKRIMCFHALGQCFHLLLDLALQELENYVKLSKLSITENRTEKLLLIFYCCFLGHIAISHPIPKIMSRNSVYKRSLIL